MPELGSVSVNSGIAAARNSFYRAIGKPDKQPALNAIGNYLRTRVSTTSEVKLLVRLFCGERIFADVLHTHVDGAPLIDHCTSIARHRFSADEGKITYSSAVALIAAFAITHGEAEAINDNFKSAFKTFVKACLSQSEEPVIKQKASEVDQPYFDAYIARFIETSGWTSLTLNVARSGLEARNGRGEVLFSVPNPIDAARLDSDAIILNLDEIFASFLRDLQRLQTPRLFLPPQDLRLESMSQILAPPDLSGLLRRANEELMPLVINGLTVRFTTIPASTTPADRQNVVNANILRTAMTNGNSAYIETLVPLLQEMTPDQQVQLLGAPDSSGATGLLLAMANGHATVIEAMRPLLLTMTPDLRRSLLGTNNAFTERLLTMAQRLPQVEEALLLFLPAEADKINPEIRQAINETIAAHLENLSQKGFVSPNGTIFLDKGRDLVSLEDFTSDSESEWCLLRRSEKVFDLVTIDTANEVIRFGKHPLTKRPLKPEDVIRGEGVLLTFGTNRIRNAGSEIKESINKKISAHLEPLSHQDGFTSPIGKIFLQDKRDLVSLEDFPGESEWCLIRRNDVKENRVFDLVTTATADHLMRTTKQHPLTRDPLTNGGIIRGDDVQSAFGLQP